MLSANNVMFNNVAAVRHLHNTMREALELQVSLKYPNEKADYMRKLLDSQDMLQRLCKLNLYLLLWNFSSRARASTTVPSGPLRPPARTLCRNLQY